MKKYIFIIMLILLSSFAYSDIIDGQVSYWKLDINSGTQSDSFGSNDGTVSGADYTTSGKINNAYDWESGDTSDKITVSDHVSLNPSSITINAWIKPESYGGGSYGRVVDKGNGADYTFYMINNAGQEALSFFTGSGINTNSDSSILTLNEWQMVTITFDGSSKELIFYVNGSESGTTTETGTLGDTALDLYIGNNIDEARAFDGIIDEVGIWNTVKTPAEILELYNGGDGLQIPYTINVTQLETTLNYPINTTHYNTYNPINTSKIFNRTIKLITNVDANCSINDTDFNLNKTGNTIHAFNIDLSALTEKNYSLTATCNNVVNTTTTNFWFIIDDTQVLVDINIFNNSIQANQFNLSTTYYDLYLYKTNTTIIRTSDNLTLYNNYSGVLGYETEYYNVTYPINLLNSTYVVGDMIKVILNGIDTHTAKEFKEKPIIIELETNDKKIKEYKLKYGNFRLEYDKELLLSEIYDYDRIKFKFIKDKDKKDKNKFSKWVEAENIVYYPESEYPCHMIVNDKYWFDCDGLNNPEVIKEYNNRYRIDFDLYQDSVISKSLGGLNEIYEEYYFTINKNYTGNILKGDFFNPANVKFNYTSLYNFTVSSLLVDTDCITITGSNITGYSKKYCYNFNKIELEDVVLFAGATDINCYINVSNSTGDIIQTNFNWYDKNKNVLKKGFNLCDSNNYCTLDELSGSLISSNDSIFCNGIINNSWFNFNQNSSYINTSEVGICNNVSLIYPIVNFTYFDELDNSVLNVSASYDLTFYEGSSTFNIQSNNTGTYTSFCTDVNPTAAIFNLKLYNTIILSASNYITRVFNIPFSQGLDISNEPYYNYSYYLIQVANSTTITYTWKDTDYGTLDGIMQIYRCEDDGTRTLIESTNVAGGKATANLQLFSTPYSYSFTKDDITYIESEYYDCHIESTDTQNYYIDISQIDVKPVIGLYLMDCHIYNVSDTIVKMEWDGNDEDATDIEACIIGYREDIYGRTKVYESCINETSGSLTRNIGLTGFNYYVQGTLKQNGITGNCQETVVFNQRGSISESAGITGIFLAAMLIIALALLVAGDNILVILSSIVAILMVWAVGILTFSWITVSSIIILGIIIALIGRHTLKGI